MFVLEEAQGQILAHCKFIDMGGIIMTDTQRQILETKRKSASALIAELKKLQSELEARQQRRNIDGGKNI